MAASSRFYEVSKEDLELLLDSSIHFIMIFTKTISAASSTITSIVPFILRANNLIVNYNFCLGRQDSSGVNLFYTDKLRTHDSAIVSTGVDINDWQIIPPKQKNWISTGYCMHQCTEVNTEMSLQTNI